MPDESDPDLEDYPFPDEVSETVEEAKHSKSRFEEVFSAPAKVAIVDVLLKTGAEPLTTSEIVEASGEISRASFSRYRDELIVDGVMAERGKRGNAQLYSLDVESPVAQALKMVDNLIGWGKTPMLVDEEYIGSPLDSSDDE